MAEFDDAMGSGLDALTQFFVNEGTLGDALLKVAELACQVSSADLAGITLLVEGKPRTGVFTDPDAVEIDEAQYTTGVGPCLDAFRHGEVFHIPSTADDTRWTSFSKEALAHGITTTLSLPLKARGEGIGALNLYSRTARTFADPTVRDQTLAFADQASIVLANAQVYWDAHQLGQNLNQAMNSRAVIDQAVGVLLSGGGHSPEEAFQMLVRASQRENEKLRNIAERVVQNAIDRRSLEP